MPSYQESAQEAVRQGRHWLVPAAYLFLRDERGRVLLQLRAGTGFMDGHWAAAAAGHVEAGESALAAVLREAREEVGVTLAPADVIPLTTMHRNQQSGSAIDQRVDFFYTAHIWQGEPALQEPGKAAGLEWFDLRELPEPVVPHELQVLRGLAEQAVPRIQYWGFPTS